LSSTTRHYWYGDSSPWTDRLFDRVADFGGRPETTASHAVIWDGENPPSGRDPEGGHDRRRFDALLQR